MNFGEFQLPIWCTVTRSQDLTNMVGGECGIQIFENCGCCDVGFAIVVRYLVPTNAQSFAPLVVCSLVPLCSMLTWKAQPRHQFLFLVFHYKTSSWKQAMLFLLWCLIIVIEASNTNINVVKAITANMVQGWIREVHWILVELVVGSD